MNKGDILNSGTNPAGSKRNAGVSGSGDISSAGSPGAHRLYSAQDMARISSSACAGCGACCRGMGDTIVLDPYDVWQLTKGLGRPFGELLGSCADLHVEEGVIMPHLKMREETESCAFLGTDGRCTVHAYRPGICRLFPLGRQFDDKKTSYFIVPNGCVKGGLSKVRIDRWIGIEDLPRYEEYKAEWRSLLRTLQARIAAEPSVEVQRNVNLYFLRTFYMTPYEGDAAAFYGELAARTRDFAAAAL